MSIEVLSIAPLSWYELSIVLLSGTLVGLERQLLGKPAGMRTCALIALSTYLFVAISKASGTDYLRVVGQVVTGVGFLGGGVILSKEGIIQGMTSAAVIWMLSAIGSTVGLGYPSIALKLTFVAILTLYIFHFLENRFDALQRGVHRLARNHKKSTGE